MLDLAKAGRRRRPDASRRAIAADEFGKARLDRAVALNERIVLGVGYFRRIQLVIALIMMRDQLGETCKFAGRFDRRERFDLGQREISSLLLCPGHPQRAPAIRLSAAARASAVTALPDSMRAISSRRDSAESSSTSVAVRVAACSLATRQWCAPIAAT